MSEESQAPSRRKIDSARNFAESAMACPGCHGILTEAANACPGCGYSGHEAVARFPFAAPPIERFIDPVGYLSEEARRKIDKSLAALKKRFPQVCLSICIIDLVAETDPREFGFWMFNASKVRDELEAASRPWTILLIIDDQNARASITPGYAIEPFLDEEGWESLLRMERKHFFAKDYETGVLRFIEGAAQILKEGAARVLRRTRKKSAHKNDSNPEGGRK
ncbi:MAG: TPM domain-containing protein [Akkermansiaceae bacterium]|jgi:uncharacterized membrane protein YgcG